MKRFEGKVVIITGSGQGLGLATAKRFCAEGAQVLGVGRTASKMENSLKEVNSPNYRVLTYDVGEKQSWVEILAFVKKTYGKLDILVNNAGFLAQQNILDMELETFMETFHCDVNPVFLGMKNCYPFLCETKGSIVNIVSVASLKVGPNTGDDPAYQSAKAAALQLTKHAAGIFAPSGIRVNAVSPGGIKTPMLDAYLAANPEVAAGVKINAPLAPHNAAPDDIIDAIMYLAGDEARAVTGANLVVDCGLMCR